jgi:hypothetical protein
MRDFIQRLIIALAVVLCVGWPAPSKADGWQLSGVGYIRLHVPSIEFDLIVTDASGQPVSNLTANSFGFTNEAVCLNEGCVNPLQFNVQMISCKMLDPNSSGVYCLEGSIQQSITNSNLTDKDAAAVVIVRACPKLGPGNITGGAKLVCARAAVPITLLY